MNQLIDPDVDAESQLPKFEPVLCDWSVLLGAKLGVELIEEKIPVNTK